MRSHSFLSLYPFTHIYILHTIDVCSSPPPIISITFLVDLVFLSEGRGKEGSLVANDTHTGRQRLILVIYSTEFSTILHIKTALTRSVLDFDYPETRARPGGVVVRHYYCGSLFCGGRRRRRGLIALMSTLMVIRLRECSRLMAPTMDTFGVDHDLK